LGNLSFKFGTHARGDVLGRPCGIGGEVVFTNIQPEHRAAPERVDPPLVARVQLRKIRGIGVALGGAPTRDDPREDRIERPVQVEQQAWWPRGG
jgi:hypothetical protein